MARKSIDSANPSTGVDQSTVQEVFNDLDCFVISWVLQTAIDIDLFPTIGRSALPPEAIIAKTSLHEQTGNAFLTICEKLGYLKFEQGLYSLNSRSETILERIPRFKAYAEDRRMFYEDLLHLTDQIRTGVQKSATLGMFPYWTDKDGRDSLTTEMVKKYSKFMQDTNPFWTNLFLEAVDLSECSGFLDIGGGAGGLAIEVANHYPKLRVGIFDLPPVTEIAKKNIDSAGLNDRIEIHSGDFHNAAFPRSFDTISLFRVGWDWRDDKLQPLLSKIWTALPPGGEIILAERMYIGDEKLDRELATTDVRFMLVDGKVRSVQEVQTLMANVGFKQMEAVSTAIPTFNLVHGKKA